MALDPDLTTVFSAAMARLGPFEPSPTIAVAASGGADSTALALLARDWATQHGGSVVALIVDHGLRTESAAEARITRMRLDQLGIPGQVLTLNDLRPGAALAERARIARYQILSQTCQNAGIHDLLLGHHQGDQIETLAMRVLRGSGTHGLAGMSAVTKTATVRLLRPLLQVAPSRLRDFLTLRDVPWVEDPSNRDRRTLRARLRQGLPADGLAVAELSHALAEVGTLRAREEEQTAKELASRASIRPEGFAILSPGRISQNALRALVWMISGSAYPPNITDFLPPGTIAGVRVMPAGRLAEGWLMVREEAAIAPPVPAIQGTLWDHRFRLHVPAPLPDGAMIGKLGAEAAGFRNRSNLPSVVLRTLPALRIGKVLAAVPHLGYADPENATPVTILFDPPRPAVGATFVPSSPVA